MALSAAALLSFAWLQFRLPPELRVPLGLNAAGSSHFAKVVSGAWQPAADPAAYAMRCRLLLLAAWAGYALALVCWRKHPPQAIWAAAALAAGLCGVLVLAPPSLSNDVYAYLVFARIGVDYHQNPYTTTPALLLANHDAAAFFFNRPHSTIYGPVWTLLTFGVTALLPGASVWAHVAALKMVSAAALLAAAVAGRELAARLAPGTAGTAFMAIAMNPLLLIEGPMNGHNDVPMACLLLISLGLWSRNRFMLACLTLGCAAAIKFLPLALLPWLLYLEYARARESGRAVRLVVGCLLALAPLVLGYLVFWSGKETFSGLRNHYVWTIGAAELARDRDLARSLGEHGVPEFLQSLLVALRRQWPLACVYAALSTYVMRRPGMESLTVAWALLALAVALLASRLLFPWYLVWAAAVSLTLWTRTGTAVNGGVVLIAAVVTVLYFGGG